MTPTTMNRIENSRNYKTPNASGRCIHHFLSQTKSHVSSSNQIFTPNTNPCVKSQATDMSSWFDNGDIGPNDVPNGDTPHVAMAKGDGAGLVACWDFTLKELKMVEPDVPPLYLLLKMVILQLVILVFKGDIWFKLL